MVNLKELEQQFLKDESLPLIFNRKKAVFGEGNPKSKIILVGEAPGKEENLQGRPFCGPAGKVLDEMLKDVELKREKVYITNVVKDQPPQNRDPSLEEISAYLPYLQKQLKIIKPKLIILLGRHALSTLLPGYGSISQLHGKAFKKDNLIYFISYHPAVALYRQNYKKILMEDFLKLKKLLKKISHA